MTIITTTIITTTTTATTTITIMTTTMTIVLSCMNVRTYPPWRSACDPGPPGTEGRRGRPCSTCGQSGGTRGKIMSCREGSEMEVGERRKRREWKRNNKPIVPISHQ